MASDDNEGVLAWAAAAVAKQPKKIFEAIKEDLTQGTGPPIAREAVGDVRNTLHQVFFGQGEGKAEPGTPMSPLQSEVAEQRKADDSMDAQRPKKTPPAAAMKAKGKDTGGVHGAKEAPASRLPSPSEIVAEKKPYQAPPEQGNSREHGNGR